MTRKLPAPPFIHVRAQENRTAAGRRSSTQARRATLYYTYGSAQQQGQRQAQARGQWLGPDGRIQTPEAVLAWVQSNALCHRYTFQAILSVPEGALTAADFGRALQKGGQPAEWRLIAHEDTRHRHAHVLWFGDRRLEKQAFLIWQTAVRAELVRLEQQSLAGRAAQQAAELEVDSAYSKSQGLGLGW